MTVQECDQVVNTVKILRREVYIDDRFINDSLYESIYKELKMNKIIINDFQVFNNPDEGKLISVNFDNNTNMNGQILYYYLFNHIWEAFRRSIHYYHFNINRINGYSDIKLTNNIINVTMTSNNSFMIII